MHEQYMKRALELAQNAAETGEVPVGCVIVRDGEIIGEGYNTRERERSALGHAELMAIGAACTSTGDWRLDGCSLYVTLEPCPMCAGAIINARVSAVYYGAGDRSMGACGGVLNIFEEGFGHKPRLYKGVLEADCSAILRSFFDKLR